MAIPDWAKQAVKELRSLRKGDVIRLNFGKDHPDNIKYHVRAIIDRQLVVRFWVSLGWAYKCLSPAWWSIYSAHRSFKLVRAKKTKT